MKGEEAAMGELREVVLGEGADSMRIVLHRIPCRHGMSGMPHEDEVPDHEPMTREELSTLLDEAAAAGSRGDWREASSLQCRLNRALPGNTCPRQVDTPVAEREARLGALFVERYAEGGAPSLVDAVWAILSESGL